MDLQGSDKILLTGAGFTHNFGAPLAQGVWSEIFNHREVQNSSRVRELMLRNFDYESAFFEINEGNYADEEKEAISEAVTSAYIKIDSTIKNYVSSSTSTFPVNNNFVNELLSNFSLGDRLGLIFTLNQDLFIERHFWSDSRPVIPGIENNQDWFTSIFTYELPRECVRLPNESELNEL